MSLEDLTLPACLEVVDGGIRIRGHRIPLASFLDVFLNEHPSIQQLHDRFPTVSTDTLRAVAVFCEEYEDIVSNYYRQQVEIANARYAQSTGPSLADLKARQNLRAQ